MCDQKRSVGDDPEMKIAEIFANHFKKETEGKIAYDPEHQEAIIHSSICTGEKVAGFKDKTTGHFTEVMLIRDESDLEQFKKLYALTSIKTEY